MLEFHLLILMSLTFFIVSLPIFFYLVIIKSKRVDTLKKEVHGAFKKEMRPHDCSHYFGYLKTYPRNVPIPDECMGCTKTLECFEAS